MLLLQTAAAAETRQAGTAAMAVAALAGQPPVAQLTVQVARVDLGLAGLHLRAARVIMVAQAGLLAA